MNEYNAWAAWAGQQRRDGKPHMRFRLEVLDDGLPYDVLREDDGAPVIVALLALGPVETAAGKGTLAAVGLDLD